MSIETKKAQMQAILDQDWATIEGIFDKSDNLPKKAMKFFGTNSEPYTPHSYAILCMSLVNMQVLFNKAKRLTEDGITEKQR